MLCNVVYFAERKKKKIPPQKRRRKSDKRVWNHFLWLSFSLSFFIIIIIDYLFLPTLQQDKGLSFERLLCFYVCECDIHKSRTMSNVNFNIYILFTIFQVPDVTTIHIFYYWSYFASLTYILLPLLPLLIARYCPSFKWRSVSFFLSFVVNFHFFFSFLAISHLPSHRSVTLRYEPIPCRLSNKQSILSVFSFVYVYICIYLNIYEYILFLSFFLYCVLLDDVLFVFYNVLFFHFFFTGTNSLCSMWLYYQ